MAARHTNLGLFVLLAAGFATGALAFAVGGRWAWAVALSHGGAGIGILMLAPWKAAIVRRGATRRRRGRAPAFAFLALIVASLAAGIAHATGVVRDLPGGITAMQVHVAAALAALPLLGLHVLARPVRPRPADLSRRTVLRAGGVAAGSLVAAGGLAALARSGVLAGPAVRATGSFERGSFDSGAMPSTQWLLDGVPGEDPSAWRLDVRSLDTTPRTLSLEELDAMRSPVRATLDCTGGWFSEQDWEAVPLARLLSPASLAHARSIHVASATGYARRFPATDAARVWIATRLGGRRLAPEHGFPARVVAPGRRGFWWVKWVTSIEASGVPWWAQPPLPLR